MSVTRRSSRAPLTLRDALVIERPAFQELMEKFGAIRLGILMALSDRIRKDERETLVS